jgi:hypothetical protein
VGVGVVRGGWPVSLLCSRNARPQKALVGRAQWATNQATLLGESEQAWGSIVGVNRSVAAEMCDDEFRVGDWVCREGGCVLTGDRGSQSFRSLADGQREGGVFLYFSEICHGIAAPSWDRESCEPRFDGMGHGAASTDSRLPVVAFLPRGFGCRKLPFN